jgi:trans-aconitate 2-methyltransferase
MADNNVAAFYDSFTNYQLNMKINIRHRTLFNNLMNIGFNKTSNVLEIGCGIGTLTSLMANYNKAGHIMAVDISPKSIDIAKNYSCNKYKNIVFIVSDMTDFYSDTAFDFIVLPDVLEHIPLEQHSNLFKTFRKYCHDNTKILINIPSPFYLRWVHKYKPDLLQVIDQPLDSDLLFTNIYDNDFHVVSLNTYSLHAKEGDYQSIVLGIGAKKAFNSITKYSYFHNLLSEIRAIINTWINLHI